MYDAVSVVSGSDTPHIKISKPPVNKTNSSNLYPPTKSYFREKSKSQKINPISPTLASPLNWETFRSQLKPVNYIEHPLF